MPNNHLFQFDPATIPSSLISLSMAMNSIEILLRTTIEDRDRLLHLETLDLGKNFIEVMPRGQFRSFSRLKVLNLSNNLLNTVALTKLPVLLEEL